MLGVHVASLWQLSIMLFIMASLVFAKPDLQNRFTSKLLNIGTTVVESLHQAPGEATGGLSYAAYEQCACIA